MCQFDINMLKILFHFIHDAKICRGSKIRTHDTWFWRPVLYQLSYTPLHKIRQPRLSNLKFIMSTVVLVEDFGYLTSTNCATTFANCETQTLRHSYRSNQINCDCNVITWHYHFSSFWQIDFTCYVKRT